MVLQLSARSDFRHHRATQRASEAFGEADVTFDARDRSTVAIPDVLAIVKRRRRLIASTCSIGLLLAALYLVLATPLYTSTASILLDTRMNQNLKSQNIVDDTPVDTSMVDSQANVLQSDSVAIAVIKKLDLVNDSEFVGPPSGRGAFLIYTLSGYVQALKSIVGMKGVDADPATLLQRTAIETFSKRLNVKRQQLSYVIDVSFDSESPEKAATIVNEITSAYIGEDLAAKVASTKSANQWLQNRLVELKMQATDADHQLQEYKARNNIVETGRGLLDQQTLSDLNERIIAARAATAEAHARLDRIKDVIKSGIPDATVTDALSNNVITRLRAQYLDAAGRRADLLRTLKSDHVAVLRIQSQMNDLARSIIGEEQRIADAYASDLAIAEARQTSLDGSLAQIVNQSEVTNQAQVRARDLESSADAFRNIYNSFLQKFQETEQAQTIPVNDSRVVSIGQIPLKKSAPKTLLAVLGGLLLGVMSGSGIAVVSELATGVYRSGASVEEDTGLRCLGTLPDLSGRLDKLKTPSSIYEWVLRAPYSRFTETIRNLYVSLAANKGDAKASVVGIVSSLPREGKTTIATNLGVLCASLGKKTLLIDGDLHERSLSKALAPAAQAGLLEALANPDRLDAIVQKHLRSTLSILPCVSEARVSDAAAVLASPQMARLLETARDQYEYIIIEFAPILAVVDVKAAGHLADDFIFVVKWGDTRKKVVDEVLSGSEMVRERTVGIVLNQADPTALRTLESYKGRLFSSYYSEEGSTDAERT